MESKGQNKPRTIKNAQVQSPPGANSYLMASVFLSFFFSESQKDEKDLIEEREIFTEMMQVIEQRDKLVNSLEEQRIKEKAEDQHFESFIFSRGYQLSRT